MPDFCERNFTVKVGDLVKRKEYPPEAFAVPVHPFWKTKTMGIVLKVQMSELYRMDNGAADFTATADIRWCDGGTTNTSQSLLEIVVAA